jgi:type IV secretion system protein VirD4
MAMTTKRKLVIGAVVAYLVLASFAIVYCAGALYVLACKSMPHDIGLGTWHTYWQAYAADPTQRKRLEFAMGLSAFIFIGLPLLALDRAFRKERPLHGDAKPATTGEVQADGLFGEGGIIIGRMAGRFVMLSGQVHVLLAAPTRQGKGVGIVIPNLLNYSDSVVVLDIKLSNFQITSLFRQKHGQKVFLFNPFDEEGRTHRWNPMDAIRRDRDLMIVDVQELGMKLYPERTDENALWNDLARDLFIGLTLYLLETAGSICTFGEVLRRASGNVKEDVQRILKTRARGEDALSDACFRALSRFASAQERAMSSIIITFNSPLLIFENPFVDAATSATDFDVARVRKERMTIYFGIPANKVESASMITNLFFAHLLNKNMDYLPRQRPDLKYSCLVLLDEFTMMGRVEVIAKNIGAMAEYNLRVMPIVQGMSQLIARYGENDARTIESNCTVQILYPPRNQRDANEYSEMLGTYTAKALSKGISSPRAVLAAGTNSGSSSENVSDQRRPLMLPQELREMPWTQQIIIKPGIRPILCEKALYFSDRRFLGRLKPLSESLCAIKGQPTQVQMEEATLLRKELQIELPKIDMALHRARVEKRVKEVAPGEAAKIDTLALVADPMKIVETLKPVANKAAPTDEEVADVVDGFFGFYDPESVKAAEEALPTRPPPGEPDGWVKPVAPADGKAIGPLRRRLGIIDLNVLKRAPPAPAFAVGGQL